MSNSNSNSNSALIVAHPGHELRILGWVIRSQPRTYILTDGSGRTGSNRVNSSRDIIGQTGGTVDKFAGQLTDRKLYRMILEKDQIGFEAVLDRLSRALIKQEPKVVVGDAAEGVIMAHDLFCEIRRQAVVRASDVLGYEIDQFEFSLTAHPHATLSNSPTDQILELSDDELTGKLELARGYKELRPLVEETINTFGEASFRIEKLFHASNTAALEATGLTPSYEDHGQAMVEQREYEEVIRFDKHVLPLVRSLQKVESSVA